MSRKSQLLIPSARTTALARWRRAVSRGEDPAHLLALLRAAAGEASLHDAMGRWRQNVSLGRLRAAGGPRGTLAQWQIEVSIDGGGNVPSIVKPQVTSPTEQMFYSGRIETVTAVTFDTDVIVTWIAYHEGDTPDGPSAIVLATSNTPPYTQPFVVPSGNHRWLVVARAEKNGEHIDSDPVAFTSLEPLVLDSELSDWVEWWDGAYDPSFSLSLIDVISWLGVSETHTLSDNGNALQRPDRASTLSGFRMVGYDGVTEWTLCPTIDRGAPNVSPTYFCGVFVIDSAANFEQLVAAVGSGRLEVKCINTSGDLAMNNTTTVNTSTEPVIGQAFLLYVGFTGSTSDFLQVNDPPPTQGSSAGTANPAAGIVMGSRSGAAGTFGNIRCAFFGVRDTPFSGPEQADFDARVLARYGPLATALVEVQNPNPTAYEVDVPGGYTEGSKPLQSIFGRQQIDYYKTKGDLAAAAKAALIAALPNGAAVLARRDVVKPLLITSLKDGMPAPGALNAVETGTPLVRVGYTVYKVMFESLPDWTVTGNLYVPDAALITPAPAVLVLCGHDTDGKVGYQSIAQGLAKLGYVAFIIDAVGLAERKQIPSNATVEEHRKVGQNLPIVGGSMAGLQAIDAQRAIDYLFTRTDIVDTNHIGVTGTSGGGTQTMLVTGIDDRITMSAPSCSVAEMYVNLKNELYCDHEQVPLDVQGLGLDWDDFLLVIAPKPCLIVAQNGSSTLSGDYFDYRSVQIIHERMVSYHTLLGNDPANFARLFTDTNGHQLDDDGKQAIARFFNFHTGGDPNVLWPSTVTELEIDLRVTPTGNVVDLPGERDSVALITDMSDAVAATRGNPTGVVLEARMRDVLQMPDVLNPTLRDTPPDSNFWQFNEQWSLLGVGSTPAITPPNYPRGYGCRYGVVTEFVDATIDGKTIQIPTAICTLYFHTTAPWVSLLPQVPNGTTAFLYVSHLSADREFSKNEREALVNTTFLANPTAAWFAVDLRGSGESQPNINSLYATLSTTGSVNGSPAGNWNDDFFARHAESYNQPLLGRRTWDLLRVIDLLASQGYTDIRLLSRGWGCNAATHAAFLDSRVTSITLKNALTRWTAVARTKPGEIGWGMGDLPRRVLLNYDLPDVYADLFANKGLSRAFSVPHNQFEYGEEPWGSGAANPAGEF